MITLNLGTMIAQLVVFLILMYLVSKYAMRPVLSKMDERANFISNQIELAQRNREQAERLVEEQKDLLGKAKNEAKEIIERSRVMKDREAEEIIKRAEEQSSRILKEAKVEINREKQIAIAVLRDEVGSLTVQLASVLLEEELDDKRHSKVINQYLEKVRNVQ